MEDLIKETSSQLNEKIEIFKKLKPEYADSIESTFKSILEEIDTYSYLKKLTYLTSLNESLHFSEEDKDCP